MSADDIDNKQESAEASSRPQALQDRTELLDQARVFLSSPQVKYDDPTATRRFLAEKGLYGDEIDQLLREIPRPIPLVPPRTYPQPPLSNLPVLLVGLARIVTWMTGVSTAAVLIYYRFILPRLTQTALTRRALKSHQIALLSRLRSTLTELKATQSLTAAVLPIPTPPPLEDLKFAAAHSLEDLQVHIYDSTSEKSAGSSDGIVAFDIPEFTLLRCAIEGCGEKHPTSEELFGMLEARYDWLKTEKGRTYQVSLWTTLTTSPHFQEVHSSAASSPPTPESKRWTYVPPTPPTPPAPTALFTSLTALRTAFPAPLPPSSPGSFNTRLKSHQGTLQSLRELTAYITTRTYNLLSPSTSMRLRGVGAGIVGAAPESQEEEVKKEIRALKSLVLNRRTFASPLPTRGATDPVIRSSVS